MKNIEINTLNGDSVLINWDNVTSVTKPENYLLGQVGDTGGYSQINFTNKQSIYTQATIEEIKNKLN